MNGGCSGGEGTGVTVTLAISWPLSRASCIAVLFRVNGGGSGGEGTGLTEAQAISLSIACRMSECPLASKAVTNKSREGVTCMMSIKTIM